MVSLSVIGNQQNRIEHCDGTADLGGSVGLMLINGCTKTTNKQ